MKYEYANNLIEDSKLDSAEIILDELATITKRNNAETAYYNLLQSKINYRLSKPLANYEILLKGCIDYYEKRNDYNHVAECYLYRGNFRYEEGRKKEGIEDVKYSEYLFPKITDNVVKNRIVNNLIYINIHEGEYGLALKYAQKNLGYALKSPKRGWIIDAYKQYAVIYNEMGKRDIANKYIYKCLDCMSDMTENDRASSLAYMAASLLNTNLPLADSLANEAIKLKRNPNTYLACAQVASSKGDNERAKQLLRMALKENKKEVEYYFYDNMRLIAYDEKDYKTAYDMALEELKKQDDIYSKRHSNNILNIQKQYDFKISELKFYRNLYVGILSVIIIAIILFTIYIYRKYELNRMKKELAEIKIMIDVYSKQIDEANGKTDDKEKEIRALKTKVEKLRDKQAEILNAGKNRYSEILSNRAIGKWSKADMLDFIEYYRLINLPCVVHLENDYSKLSPRYIIFMILEDMGKDDNEICRIMTININTIRSIRSRINGKKIS